MTHNLLSFDERYDQLLLTYGEDCRDDKLVLRDLTLENVYEMVKSGSHGLIERTRVLRTVRNFSKERYRYMKLQLPFFSASHFEAGKRKITAFLRAVGCIMDVDWKDRFVQETYQAVTRDPRVVLAYISPSGCGFKTFFVFEQPIIDPRVYKSVYLANIRKFAHEYDLLQYVDLRTHDVTRISFLCHDPHVVYQPEAVPIPSVLATTPQDTNPAPASKEEIPPDIYRSILQKLGTRPKRKHHEVAIPEAIQSVLPVVEKELAEFDMRLIEQSGIQYGVKLKVQYEDQFGSVNLYHGKQGFSVVTSPRRGTDPRLNKYLRQIILRCLPYDEIG